MRTLTRAMVVGVTVAVALAVGLLGLPTGVSAEDPYFERILVQGYTCANTSFDDGTGTVIPQVTLTGSVIREWNVPEGGTWTYDFSTISPFSRYLAGMVWDYQTAGLTGSMQHNVAYPVTGLTYPAVFRYVGDVVDATDTPVYHQTFEVTCTADGPAIVGPSHEDFGVTEVPTAETPTGVPAAETPVAVPAAPRTTG